MVCMGTFFGSTQTALSSFSASFATSELAGLLYAVMGLSSAAAALSVAYWPQRFTVNARWLACAALMAGLALLLLLPSTALPMILVLLVLGLPVGPLMVTVFAIGGLVAPAGKLGTVMTALASGIVAGTAIGSSIAGQLAQHQGYSTAFLCRCAPPRRCSCWARQPPSCSDGGPGQRAGAAAESRACKSSGCRSPTARPRRRIWGCGRCRG